MKRTAKEMSVSHSGKRSLQLVVCNMGDGVTEEKGRERGRKESLSQFRESRSDVNEVLPNFFFFLAVVFHCSHSFWQLRESYLCSLHSGPCVLPIIASACRLPGALCLDHDAEHRACDQYALTKGQKFSSR